MTRQPYGPQNPPPTVAKDHDTGPEPIPMERAATKGSLFGAALAILVTGIMAISGAPFLGHTILGMFVAGIAGSVAGSLLYQATNYLTFHIPGLADLLHISAANEKAPLLVTDAPAHDLGDTAALEVHKKNHSYVKKLEKERAEAKKEEREHGFDNNKARG